MGASTSFRVYKDSLGKEKIKTLWADDVAVSRNESGSSYSGEIGMLGPKIKSWFDQNEEGEEGRDRAYEFIETTHQKWQPAIAVSYTLNKEKYWVVGGWCSS